MRSAAPAVIALLATATVLTITSGAGTQPMGEVRLLPAACAVCRTREPDPPRPKPPKPGRDGVWAMRKDPPDPPKPPPGPRRHTGPRGDLGV